MVDDMESDQEEKRFMHHYKMPPFSNNETHPVAANMTN
jgi:polyribonucleotide nucleotidyltransferase